MRPHRADIVRGISGGATMSNTRMVTSPALPKTMTTREHRLFSHAISDPGEIMAGYPEFLRYHTAPPLTRKTAQSR